MNKSVSPLNRWISVLPENAYDFFNVKGKLNINLNF